MRWILIRGWGLGLVFRSRYFRIVSSADVEKCFLYNNIRVYVA